MTILIDLHHIIMLTFDAYIGHEGLSILMTSAIGLLLFLILIIFKFTIATKALPGVPKLEGNIISFMYIYLRRGIPELLNRLIAISNDGISYTNVAKTVVVLIHEPALVREVLNLPVEVASR